jgi:hypothetical protein
MAENNIFLRRILRFLSRIPFLGQKITIEFFIIFANAIRLTVIKYADDE